LVRVENPGPSLLQEPFLETEIGAKRDFLREYLEAAEQAAEAAGRLLMAAMGRVAVEEKSPGDLVTEADRASQELIRQSLLSRFPTHLFWGEESDRPAAWDRDFCWVIDPLDGTKNFVHQLPSFSVSIALLSRGEPIVGVVHDPWLQETYKGSKGGGASWNTRVLRPSSCRALASSLLVFSFPSRVTAETAELRRFNRVVPHATLRRLGSAALNLCYVAAGRLDGYWGSTLNLWDIAAGMLIAREAGACATHLSGRELDWRDPQFLATATPELHAELLPLLQLD
jgi:myo-inositol-1(or 4)-monophosphatase